MLIIYFCFSFDLHILKVLHAKVRHVWFSTRSKTSYKCKCSHFCEPLWMRNVYKRWSLWPVCQLQEQTVDCLVYHKTSQTEEQQVREKFNKKRTESNFRQLTAMSKDSSGNTRKYSTFTLSQTLMFYWNYRSSCHIIKCLCWGTRMQNELDIIPVAPQVLLFWI